MATFIHSFTISMYLHLQESTIERGEAVKCRDNTNHPDKNHPHQSTSIINRANRSQITNQKEIQTKRTEELQSLVSSIGKLP